MAQARCRRYSREARRSFNCLLTCCSSALSSSSRRSPSSVPSSRARTLASSNLYPIVALRKVPNDHVKLLALYSSYSDRLGCGGLQVRMVLEPANHVLGCLHHLRCASPSGLVDFLSAGETQTPHLSPRDTQEVG